MTAPIRGLAIAGGGAKGAYSFGCLKALKDVPFHAVAGTSAGALNAAIVASCDMDLGEDLWLRVTPESTLQPWPWMHKAGTWPARFIFLSILIPNLLVSRLRGRPLSPGGDRLANIVLCLLLFAYLACAFAIIKNLTGNPVFDTPLGSYTPFATYVLPAVWAASFLLILEFSQWPVTKRALLYLNTPVLLAIFSLLWFDIMEGLLNSQLGKRFDDLHWITQWPLVIAYILIVLILSSICVGITSIIFSRIGHSLADVVTYDSSGLRRTIEHFLQAATLLRPVYATIASKVELFDPDEPFWIHAHGRQSWLRAAAEDSALSNAQRQGPWIPSSHSAWLQHYVRFDKLQSSNAIDILTASAALPFGVSKAVSINGISYVDGGVADNFPLLPLADHGCEEIFLLCLGTEEHEPTTGHSIWEGARAAHLKRRTLLAARPLPGHVPGNPPPDLKNDPPQIVPMPVMKNWPHIVVFRPSRRLGGLFNGLLNFSSDYTERMIRSGERDMRAALNMAVKDGKMSRPGHRIPNGKSFTIIDLPTVK